jgi:hypothetical protein
MLTVMQSGLQREASNHLALQAEATWLSWNVGREMMNLDVMWQLYGTPGCVMWIYDEHSSSLWLVSGNLCVPSKFLWSNLLGCWPSWHDCVLQAELVIKKRETHYSHLWPKAVGANLRSIKLRRFKYSDRFRFKYDLIVENRGVIHQYLFLPHVGSAD